MLKFVNELNSKRKNCLYHSQQVDGTVRAMSRIRVDFKYNGLKFSRTLTASQDYTWVGKALVCMSEAASSLDGLNKKYLTLDGAISTENVFQELKNLAGLQSNIIAEHTHNVAGWRWYDNHVALLVNLLRFYILSDLDERSKLSTGKFPVYDDGHVIIDLNDTLLLEDKAVDWTWPGRRVDESYPYWNPMTEFLPVTDDPHIDLRPLTEEEAKVVLMMTGEWKPQTNYKLDFYTPRLAEKIMYRYRNPISSLNEWLDAEGTAPTYYLPKSRVIWSALRKYVTHNNLYNQFYTATNIVAQVMLTVYPDTAEGMTWLTHVPEVHLPKFGSVRGRYPFLNSGEAAFIQAKALEDWAALIAKPELLFTYGMMLASTLNIGLAVRDAKASLLIGEDKSSFDDTLFLTPETFFASAVSLATGLDAPLNGMGDVYVFYPELVNINETWEVPAVILEPNGYLIKDNHILSTGIPFVGSPYLVYPLAVFDEANPYSGNFVLPEPLRRTRKGAIYSFVDAWKMGWAARIAGYDLSINVFSSNVNYTKYFSPNNNSWSHVLTNGIDDKVEGVLIKDMTRRSRHFVDLPNFFVPGNHPVTEVKVNVLGTSVLDAAGNKNRAAGTANEWVTPSSLGLQIVSKEDVRRFWGHIKRHKSGLAMEGLTMSVNVPAIEGNRGVEVM